jgi:hypothetical protein
MAPLIVQGKTCVPAAAQQARYPCGIRPTFYLIIYEEFAVENAKNARRMRRFDKLLPE